MAKARQFTIALDNRPGAVADVVKILGDAKVNIRALSASAQGAAGTVHLIAEDARRAKKALDDARISYQETPADEYELPNKPGALAQCLEKLAAKNVNLSSIYATATAGGKRAIVICAAEPEVKARSATA